MWQIFDILEYGIRGALMLYLCENTVEWKERYKKQGKYLFFLLFVAINFWMGNSPLLKRVLYGNDGVMKNSSSSILKLGLVIVIYFLLLDFFYQGCRLFKLYIVLLYEVIFEMARFGIHGFWSIGIESYITWWTNRSLNNNFSTEIFYGHMEKIQYVCFLILTILYVSIMYVVIRCIRKYQKNAMRDIHKQGVLFLMIFTAVGMAFDVVLRCLFFTMEGGQTNYLYDRHKSMYAVIPAMAFLCLAAVVYSIKIYGELMQAEEEKNRLIFYKQQLTEMTGHVQEMERLYDGIRGMRHDMNNYIADMEQLLGISMKEGNLEKTAHKEAYSYLCRMKDAMDSLTMHYSTGNPVMDVILNRKWQECEKKEIILESDFLYPESLWIESFDLGILLNNALDNAIEACDRCNDETDKKIWVHSYLKGVMFFLRIENTCNGSEIVYTKEGGLQTAKEDEWKHGIGLKNMKSIVERYYGTMSYEIREDIFRLTIMLEGPRAQRKEDCVCNS